MSKMEQYIDRSGGPDACWPWTRSLVNGYARLWVGFGANRRTQVTVHRVVHEMHSGDTSESVDHLCHDPLECKLANSCPHRACCNPKHLEGVTRAENTSRAKTGVLQESCLKGHLFDEQNTYTAPNGSRSCRNCAAERTRAARAELAQNKPDSPRGYRPRNMSFEQIVDWGIGDQTSPDECWRWGNGVVNGSGYASVSVGDRVMAAHRLVHEVKIGPIPSGFVVDHVCHNPEICEGGLTCPHRACVNPSHLKAVSNAENVGSLRASRPMINSCNKGHNFTPENTYTDSRGSRHCRACHNARARSYNKAARPERLKRDFCKAGKHPWIAGTKRCADCRRDYAANWARKKREADKLSRIDPSSNSEVE